ncbi:MAG: acyl-CoA thioesterase [Myxococcota bacterium]
MDALPAKRPSESATEMVQIVLPSDANALGAAFGGSVMGWIDICAAVAAQRHSRQIVVTASMDDLHFHAPIKVGWTVTLRARVIAAFKSSMEVGVTVHAENIQTGERTLTTSALLTFVALDKDGKRLPVPPLAPDTDEERACAAEAQARRGDRLARKDLGRAWVGLLAKT